MVAAEEEVVPLVVHVSDSVDGDAVLVTGLAEAVDVALITVELLSQDVEVEDVVSCVTVCVLTTVTAVVDVVGDSTDTTDTSVCVTVFVVWLAEAVTVTSSVVVFVSAEADAVTVWTTVVVASVASVVGEDGDPPSMGTTEYGCRGRRAWNLPTEGSSARGRHVEGLWNANRSTTSCTGRMYRRILLYMY